MVRSKKRTGDSGENRKGDEIMAIHRKLPFGYYVQMGKMIVHEGEADLVRMVFRKYGEGSSLLQLTNELNCQPISYGDSSVPWNKHMVARILKNKKYLGDENTPGIITSEEWQKASRERSDIKDETGNVKEDKIIRQLARCSECGSKPELIAAHPIGTTRWRCTNCGELTTKANTSVTVENLKNIIAMLSEQPYLIQIVESPRVSERIHLNNQEKDFTAAISNTAFDEDNARKLAFTLASARFDALGSEDYETERIRREVAEADLSGSLDYSLVKSIASEILIHPNGSVSLKLKNNQIMKGEDVHA